MGEPRNILVLKKKKGETTTELGRKKTEMQKPQGGLDLCPPHWMPHYTNFQTLRPINELHKLQLKPWALI